MAERRMFSKTIVDSDAFIEMPQSSQNLYFHFGMRADDDGFLNNPKKIQRMIGASDDDYKLLCAKSFLIPFDNGLVVIKHWRIHNFIRSDRYKPTVHQEEKASLSIKPNGAYTCNLGIPLVDHLDTQVRLGKDRIGEEREEESEANASPPPPPVRIGNDGTSRFERAKTAGAVIFSPVRKNFIHLRDDERREVLATFTYYSDDEIAAAIKTYAEMLKDDQYDIFAPYASLIGFLRSGVEKYVDEAKPWDVFKKRSAAEASQEKIDWEKIREDLRAKEAERDK
jgi:hypothetical protein